jgi:hypothetical protein
VTHLKAKNVLNDYGIKNGKDEIIIEKIQSNSVTAF